MGMIQRFAANVGRQLLWSLVLVCTVLLWSSAILHPENIVFSDVTDVGPGIDFYLKTTGLALVIGGYAYLQLPIDLIPDFIPFFGQLDDGISALAMIGGAGMIILGFVL